jgi:hypothetical protein
MKLIEILTGSLSYYSSWAVYAEKIDGKFTEQSPARFGQIVFENGGLLDNLELFGSNDTIVDAIQEWTDGDPEFTDEAARILISNINNND